MILVKIKLFNLDGGGKDNSITAMQWHDYLHVKYSGDVNQLISWYAVILDKFKSDLQ